MTINHLKKQILGRHWRVGFYPPEVPAFGGQTSPPEADKSSFYVTLKE
jgi:hypothetical protein